MKKVSFNREKVFWEIFDENVPELLVMANSLLNGDKDVVRIIVNVAGIAWRTRKTLGFGDSEEQFRRNVKAALFMPTRDHCQKKMRAASSLPVRRFSENSFFAPLIGKPTLNRLSSVIDSFPEKETILAYMQNKDHGIDQAVLVKRLLELQIACYKEITFETESGKGDQAIQALLETAEVPILYHLVGAAVVKFSRLEKYSQHLFHSYLENPGWDNKDLSLLQGIFRTVFCHE